MRRISNVLIIATLLQSFCTIGQLNLIQPIDSLDKFSSHQKVIILSADWCSICKSTIRLLENSESIRTFSDSVKFFEFNESLIDPILFNGQVYFYEPTGLKTGRHQLMDFLNSEKSKIIFPTIIFISRDNRIVLKKEGYMNESEWLLVLNQFKE